MKNVRRAGIAANYYAPAPLQKWKAVPHVLVLIGCVLFGGAYEGPLTWLVALLVALIGSLQIIGLFSLLHEAAHGHLAADRRTNDLLGELLAAMVVTSFVGYRACHLQHHATFRSPDDPQEVIHLAKGRPAQAAVLLMVALIGAPFFLVLRSPYAAWTRGRRLAAIRGPLAGLAFYGGLLFVLPVPAAITLATIVGATLVLGSLNDIVYHQGLAGDASLRACSSLDSDVFGQMFLCGANRHAEHHVYPNVPGARLPALSRLVRHELEAQGAVYDRGFTVAFVRRLFAAPLFLPQD